MLQRIRVAALAIVLGAGALVLAPTTATAAQTPTISPVSISPSPPLVVFDSPVTATFTFTTKGATTAELNLDPPGISAPTPLTPLDKSVSGDVTTWKATKAFEAKDAGKWTFFAVAHGSGDASTNGSFDVAKALDTSIGNFGARPDLVDKGDLIRVSGRLLAGGDGYSGQTVKITFRARGAASYSTVTTVTSGRGGWFGARVRADVTGYWRAEFAATSVARGSVSDSDRVDVRFGERDSRIVRFDASPEPVDKGARITLSGNLLVEGRDGVRGQRVSIFFKPGGAHRWQYVTSTFTGRHGRFATSVTAETSGWWRASYRGAPGVDGTSSAADWVRVVLPPPPPPEKADTRLIKFNAYPEPVKRGRYLRFSGKLQVDDDGVWAGYRAQVALFFRPAGSSKWQFVRTTWSNGSGKLYTKVKAWKSGSWRFEFRGDEDTRGDVSRRDYVRVKR
ncbi:hypothetical protein HII36_47540 [Nonomuraea sp. NN258]|uniref:hypothetical protein n=1 Tax=Nonomuraea antri TaxID=2730852 RepID=UPI00156A2A75|nr:hypothetical protein [Nonomuraea antri]NRQ39430.1 hypothetical protein [Nonomuraea antri]